MHLDAEIAGRVESCRDELIDLRRVLHRRPELSLCERETTALVRERLAAVGLTEEPCPTETGAVFSLNGARPGATVLVRADIDALPVHEDSGLAFASEIDGRMHACGHDVHTAILDGVATVLAELAEELAGRFVFVFQPAEELVSGAQAMVDGGLLERFQPAAAIGCHVTNALPTGVIATRPGLLMAGVRGLRVSVRGAGGHGAMQPRRGNVVLAVARFADLLDRVVADLSTEGTACVCSPGVIRAGTAPNVVPTAAELHGTLRYFDPEQLAQAEDRLVALAAEVSAEFDVDVAVEHTYRTGPVRNDMLVTRRVVELAGEMLGADHVLESPVVAASDDVSVLLEHVPGCYLLLGGALPDRPSGAHHSPSFAVHEDAIGIGATLLATTAAALADRPAPRP